MLAYIARARQYWSMVLSGILFAAAFICLGLLHHSLSLHFTAEERLLDQQSGYLEGVVTDGPEEKKNSWLVRLEGKAFLNDTLRVNLEEFVQVYLPFCRALQNLSPGQHVLVYGRMDRIRNRGNPGEFDYAGYMSRKRTRFQFFVRDTVHFRILDERGSAPGYGAARVRQRIIKTWNRSGPDAAVLSALTLGYKSLLDRETKSAFSDAGAMHLLAVSGLHVGMIWWILEKLLRFPSHGALWRQIRQLLIIAVLWGYAAVTGFSDSVTRSVTMFSLLSLSRAIQRTSNIYNTLLLSAFLLLVLKPSRILEPGFQLSYLAVAGIVTIQPLLEKWYAGVHWLPRRILDLISVSIAAQVSTLPLVLTYFHQFPVWFLLTNLSAIPLVSIILALFVLFVPFLLFFPQWTIFSRVLLWIAGLLNKVVTGIAALPGSVIRDVMPDPAAMMLLLAILAGMCMFVYYKKVHFIALSMLLLSAVLGLPLTRDRQLIGRSSITFFNTNEATLISGIDGKRRETFLLPADTVPGPYLQEYVRSLSGIPPGLSAHRIHCFTDGDTLTDPSWFRMTDGIWTARMGECHILIVGKCDPKTIGVVIHSFQWQVIVFRRGSPLYGWRECLQQFSGRLVGDGTLRKYEMTVLGEQVPAIWFTGAKGPLVIHGEAELLPLTNYPL